MPRLFSTLVVLGLALSCTFFSEADAVRLRTAFSYKQAFVDGFWRGLAGKDAVVTYTPVNHYGQVYYLPHAKPAHHPFRLGHARVHSNAHLGGHGHGYSNGHANQGHSNGHALPGYSSGHGYNNGNGHEQNAGYHNVGYSNHYG